MGWPEPVVLTGRHAVLEPLSSAHADALGEAVKDGELWTLWFTSVPSPDGMAEAIAARLALQARGAMTPFVVLSGETGLPIGMTSYCNVDPANSRLEIGYTWYRGSAQRTPVNTECKLMLLRHAFETLDCIAVEFRTHVLNQASRRAIERLGARLDGILRNHQRHRDGTLRDTCVYSIIQSEWPTVRRSLEWKLERGAVAPSVRS